MLSSLFIPIRTVSLRSVRILIAGQVFVFVVWWALATPAIIPKPWEVFQSFQDLWGQGLVGDLYTSLLLYLEALGLAAVLSLLVSYSAALAFFRPMATTGAKLRFLGMSGLPFLFTLYIQGAHELKLAMLTFSMSVFLITGMLDALDAIPKEKYDLARTLRMNEWQVLWEVQVLGRADVMFDVIRQNAAIGWLALGMVEGLFRSEGGIGAVLMTQDKHFHLAAVAAIQLAILGLGLGQDYLLGVVKNLSCPYASLLLERR